MKGEEYNEDLEVTQININNFKKADRGLSMFCLQERETNELYTSSLKIFDLNIVKCRDIYYNNLRKEVPNYMGSVSYLRNR